MQDGHTMKRRVRPGQCVGLAGFLESYEPTLVVLRGSLAGEEHPLDRDKLVLGRGPGVDLAIDDDEMSSQHAAVEFTGAGFRICDLGSTNGTFVNGKPVHAKDLEAGDRIELGRHLLQLRLEERPREPRVHLVPDD
jgi:pSer/pThr/pTyr-binding forkhead associated (FHA) protein